MFYYRQTKRSLRIIGKWAWLELRNWRSYRASFLMGLIGDLAWLALSIIFFQSVYSHVHQVGGWGWADVLLLIGTAQVIEGLYGAVFAKNVTRLSSGVRKGSLDRLLLYPADTQLFLTVGRIDLRGLLSALMGVGVVVYALDGRGYHLQLGSVFMYVCLLLGGLLVRLSSAFLVEMLSFRYVETGTLRAFQNEFYSYSAYPQAIYPGVVTRLLFTVVVPVIWMANIPVSALREAPGMAWWLLFPPLMALLSRLLFVRALKGYQSAGG